MAKQIEYKGRTYTLQDYSSGWFCNCEAIYTNGSVELQHSSDCHCDHTAVINGIAITHEPFSEEPYHLYDASNDYSELDWSTLFPDGSSFVWCGKERYEDDLHEILERLDADVLQAFIDDSCPGLDARHAELIGEMEDFVQRFDAWKSDNAPTLDGWTLESAKNVECGGAYRLVGTARDQDTGKSYEVFDDMGKIGLVT